MPDKYEAVWVSHTSISDFLQCPRAYYLKNVYKNPQTHHKVQLMSPPLALGQVVHSVLESLSVLPGQERFRESLIAKFERNWQLVAGQKGGFFDQATEEEYKERGREMLRKVMAHPGPLTGLAVKIKEDLPHYWLSKEEGIILCGKIDWLEYLKKTDSVHIIDFKTSKNEENESSLQLPIYHLLVHNCQHRDVSKASYWYLGLDQIVEKTLPDLAVAHRQIFKIAKEIKLARQLGRFKCPHGEAGCFACRPFEKIIRGEAQFVGENDYHYDVYVLKHDQNELSKEENSELI
ncbi:MAG TPA: PD-(D/E)XK nuclease family protein [Candidatus Woesebacteria bacterium]|nr:PD-(D/E)XK nuclease family protein [Candidatus Woesebacteria bacterium]